MVSRERYDGLGQPYMEDPAMKSKKKNQKFIHNVSERHPIFLKDNHLSFTCIDDVKTICKPLFDSTEIDYFYYVRIYPDQSYIRLGNDISWHQFCLNHAHKIFTRQNNYFSQQDFKQNKPVFLIKEPKSSALANRLFGIHSFVCLIRQREHYLEELGFATRGSNPLGDFYLNHQNILEKFRFYFLDKAEHLIEQSESKHRIQTFNPMNGTGVDLRAFDTPISQLTQMITPNRYYLKKGVYLSQREYECVKMLASGKNTKEVSRKLDISDRTVEEYIHRAKKKYGVYSRSELIDDFLKQNL